MKSTQLAKHSVVVAVSLLFVPACLAERLYDEGGPLGGLNFEDPNLHEFVGGAITGDVGPERVDGPGNVSGTIDGGYSTATVTVGTGFGEDAMTIVNLYEVPLVEGTVVETDWSGEEMPEGPTVDVTGCSQGNSVSGYGWDTWAEEAEVEVVPCGCDEENTVDVIVTARFRDWSNDELTTAVTTLRARRNER